MKTCSDIMTPDPVSCLATDSIEHVARLMQSEDIGSLPVVDDERSRQVVGIVTDRDLAVNALTQRGDGHNLTVEMVMTHNPVTCREHDGIDKAMKAMADYQVRRMPIVNDQNELVGIIAQADIATRTEEPVRTADVIEEISKPEAF
jgi:CBS-domain-containing membrane protein